MKDMGGNRWVVTIKFESPRLTTPEWPYDTCDIGRASELITGATWLVELNGRVILSVSPRWGTTDCLPF